MIEDHLVMARFNSRIEQCKTPKDLDSLCKTYLAYREKDKPKTIDMTNYFTPPNNSLMMERRIDVDYHIDRYHVEKMKAEAVYDFANQIGKHILNEGYMRIDESHDVRTMQHIMRAIVYVTKPQDMGNFNTKQLGKIP